MRTTAHQTRENRAITVDFQHEATYVQLLGDGKAFVEGSVTDSCAMTSVAEKSSCLENYTGEVLPGTPRTNHIDIQ
jgi:hypothetical protein